MMSYVKREYMYYARFHSMIKTSRDDSMQANASDFSDQICSWFLSWKMSITEQA